MTAVQRLRMARTVCSGLHTLVPSRHDAEPRLLVFKAKLEHPNGIVRHVEVAVSVVL